MIFGRPVLPLGSSRLLSGLRRAVDDPLLRASDVDERVAVPRHFPRRRRGFPGAIRAQVPDATTRHRRVAVRNLNGALGPFAAPYELEESGQRNLLSGARHFSFPPEGC